MKRSRRFSFLLAASLIAFFVEPFPTPGQESPETILLKDYRPKSLYRIPKTDVPKAKYPVIDMHTHQYAETPEKVTEWVKIMDEAGVEKSIVLTGAVGAEFDAIYQKYSKYPDRFQLWCDFDYTGYDKPGFGLPDGILKKVYRDNAAKILNSRPRS